MPQVLAEPTAVEPSVRSQLRRNTASIGAARIGSVALDGLTYILTARYFGPAQYGQYLAIVAFLNLVDLASDMTVMDITVREIAKEPERAGRWLAAGTILRMALAAVGLCGFAIYTRLAGFQGEALRAAAWAALILPAGALRTPLALFRARMKMHYELAIVIATRALNLLLFAGLMLWHGRMPEFFLATVASRTLLAVLAWSATYGVFQVRPASAAGCLWRLIRAAAPMGLSGAFVAIQFKADILILAKLAGSAAAGLYGAIAQLPEYSLYLPVIISTPVLPVLSRAFAERARSEFQEVYSRMARAVVLLLIPLALPAMLAPRFCLNLIFGPAYDAIAPVLPLIVLSMAALWISHATAIAAVAAGLQAHFIWIQSLCVALYLSLDWMLAPKHGAVAAAGVRLVASAIAPAITYVVVKRCAGFGIEWRAQRMPGAATN